MTKKINTAIVGFGRWGQLLYDASKSTDRIQVTSVVTRSPTKVQDLCLQQGLDLTSDLASVLNNRTIEALIIATPHTQHFDQLMAAAHAGKHVYCEKPFTLDPAQANSALAEFARANRKVAIGHNRRFAPNTRALREMLDHGQLGDLVHIDGIFNAYMAGSKGQWRDNVAESPAGGMTSLGIHVVDMFIHLVGQIEELSADSRKISSDCDFDDNTCANMTFANAARGHLTTLTSTAMRWQISVYGTLGAATLQDQDRLILQPVQGPGQTLDYPGYEYPAIATITTALDAFGADIQDNIPFPVSPAEIAHGTAVLAAIIESARDGRRIALI